MSTSTRTVRLHDLPSARATPDIQRDPSKRMASPRAWTSLSARYQPWLLSLLGAAGVACYLFPVYWMIASGLKTSAEIFASPPTLIPREPTLSAYEYVIVRENVFRYLRNSLIIAVPVTALTVLLGAMGAYAMSRMRSRLVDAALLVVLMLQVFPEALLATPMFIIFRTLDILNTYTAVILATTSKTLAFALVILRPMFRQVPYELEEASFVDGCNRLQTFWLVVLPIVKVALMVVGALSFVQAYGQFVYAITLLNEQELQPATVGIYSFVGAEYADWHRVMAFSSIFVVPILVLFLALQSRIVSGLTAGALK
jgi:multiple sugar transport system permease protein